MTLTTIKKAGLDDIALDHVFTIGASGSSAYTFQGEGLNGTVNNPTLYLTRGKTYRFENGSGGHPIRIQSTSGASGTAYNTGVTNNAGSGTVIVEVQHDAPDVLYYQCTSHAAMNGILYITGALADGGVTAAKLASNSVTNAAIANDSIHGDKISTQTISLAKLVHGTSSQDGKFLRANNGADPTFETVNTNLVADTSPQLGGNLASNGNDINFADGDKVIFGTDSDLQIYHESNNSWIKELGSGSMNINTNRLNVANAADNEVLINAQQDGSVDLYYDGSKKFETTTNGVHVTGDLRLNDNEQIYLGNSTDLQLFHDPSVGNVINNAFCHLVIRDTSGTTGAIFKNSGAVELNHNGSKKLETTSTGIKIGDRVEFNGNTIFDNSANGNNIGIAFDSAGAITPTDGAANRVNDSKSLGTSSYQWNNLHLSGSANIGNYVRTNYDGGAHVYFKNNSQGANFSSHFQTYESSNEGGTTQTHIHYYHGGYAELLHQGSSAIRTRSGGGVEFRNGGTRIGIFDPEGIKFGTDTSSSNGLDDYEEGGFTPTFHNTWTNVSASDVRHAKYVKIGGLVHIYMEFFMTGNNGGWQTASYIGGFPFTGLSSYYSPVNLAVMYGPSGYDMDGSAAGRAYFDAAAKELYMRMGTFSGVRHLWLDFTYRTT